MQRYRFQFGDVGGVAGETIESDHSSGEDAMCDAARTAAEMLKEQAQAGPGLNGFTITILGPDGQGVGGIEVLIRGASDRL